MEPSLPPPYGPPASEPFVPPRLEQCTEQCSHTGEPPGYLGRARLTWLQSHGLATDTWVVCSGRAVAPSTSYSRSTRMGERRRTLDCSGIHPCSSSICCYCLGVSVTSQSRGVIAARDWTYTTLFLTRFQKGTGGRPLWDIIWVYGPRRCWAGCFLKTNWRICGLGGCTIGMLLPSPPARQQGHRRWLLRCNPTTSARHCRARLQWTATWGPRHTWLRVCRWWMRSSLATIQTSHPLKRRGVRPWINLGVRRHIHITSHSHRCRLSATHYTGRGHRWGLASCRTCHLQVKQKTWRRRRCERKPRSCVSNKRTAQRAKSRWGLTVALGAGCRGAAGMLTSEAPGWPGLKLGGAGGPGRAAKRGL